MSSDSFSECCDANHVFPESCCDSRARRTSSTVCSHDYSQYRHEYPVSPVDINKKYWQKILCTCVCTCLAAGGYSECSSGSNHVYHQMGGIHRKRVSFDDNGVSKTRSDHVRGLSTPGMGNGVCSRSMSQGFPNSRSSKGLFHNTQGLEGTPNHTNKQGAAVVGPRRKNSQLWSSGGYNSQGFPRRVNSQGFEGAPRLVDGKSFEGASLRKSKSGHSRGCSQCLDCSPRRASTPRGTCPHGCASSRRGVCTHGYDIFPVLPVGICPHGCESSPRGMCSHGYQNLPIKICPHGCETSLPGVCSHGYESSMRGICPHGCNNSMGGVCPHGFESCPMGIGENTAPALQTRGGRSTESMSSVEQSVAPIFMGKSKAVKTKDLDSEKENVYGDVKLFIGGASMYFPIFMLGIPKFKRCGAVNKRWGNTNLRVHAILHETLPPAECYNDGTSCMCKVKAGEHKCAPVSWPPASPSFIGESPALDDLRVLTGEHVIWETFVDIRMVFLGEDPINGDEIFSCCMPRVPSYDAYVKSVRDLRKRVSSYERKQIIKANLKKTVQDLDLNTCTFTVRCVLYESELQERPVRILGDGLTKVPCNKIKLQDGSKFDGQTCMSGWKTIPKNLDIDFKRGSHYELQWPANRQATDRPTIYSLRDGCLQEGTDLFDLGLHIKFVTRVYSEWWARLPFMHYFDEIKGVWRQKDFSVNRSSRRTTEYFVQIPNAKRVIFIIGDRKDKTKWIKAEGEYDFMLPFSGCYEVFESGKTIQLSKSVPLMKKKRSKLPDIKRQDSIGNSSELSLTEFPSAATPGFREGKLSYELPDEDELTFRETLLSPPVLSKEAEESLDEDISVGILTPEKIGGQHDNAQEKRVEFYQIDDVYTPEVEYTPENAKSEYEAVDDYEYKRQSPPAVHSLGTVAGGMLDIGGDPVSYRGRSTSAFLQ